MSKPRLILWIIIAATLVAVFLGGRGEYKAPPSPAAVGKGLVASDFRKLKNVEVPPEMEETGLHAGELMFSKKFAGTDGDSFWALMQDGKRELVVKYTIRITNKGLPAQARYLPSAVYGSEYRPTGEIVKIRLGGQKIESR